MVKLSLLLSYKGLPKSWETTAHSELSSAAKIKVEKACKALREKERGGVVYIQGDPAIIFKELYSDTEDISEFSGLSFPTFFKSTMDKDSHAVTLNTTRFTFIYDVGDEAAVNKTYAGQLLRQLLTECRNEEVWCFVCGTDTKTKFERDYGIELRNSLTLPNKTETTLL